MSKKSLLEYCSSLCCCSSRSTIFSLVFWNASCKMFDVFWAAAASLDISSFCLTIDSNYVARTDNVLILLYFVEKDHFIVTEHSLATLGMTI